MRAPLTALLSLLLALLVLVACGKKPSDFSTAKEQQDSAASTVANNHPAATSKQEKPTVTLPAGTPVTVRLQTPVSSAASQAGEIFDAVLDEPLSVDGQTVASRGAAARGKVTIAQHSGRLHHPGELGLTLVSVSVQGQDVPLESSHIYAKGSSHKKRNLA